MEEWKEYKIGEIAQTNVAQYSLSESWAIIQYLDTGSITKNQISNISLYSGKTDLPSRARRKVKDGDIIFSAVRPNLCHYGYMDNPPSNLLVSTGFVVITVNAKIVDPRFLYYYLTQNEIVDQLHAIGEQAVSTYPTIRPSDIGELSVSLPPLSEQKRISSILYSLDSKISCNSRINDNFAISFLLLICFVLWLLRRINDNLQQQARALYKSWFVDFDPFKDGQFEDSELGLIPRGWSIKQLGEITTQINDRVKERVDVKVLSPITTGELVLSEEYFTKQVYSESISKYIVVRPSDFAYNPARVNIGSLGMNEYEFDGCVSPVYVVFRCEDEYQHFFDLFRRTQRFQDEVNARSIGGVRQTMSYKEFSQIKLIYPSKEVVGAFNEVYLSLKKIISAKHEENVQLASLRDSLLPKIMSRSTIL